MFMSFSTNWDRNNIWYRQTLSICRTTKWLAISLSSMERNIPSVKSGHDQRIWFIFSLVNGLEWQHLLSDKMPHRVGFVILPCLGCCAVDSKVETLVELCWKHFTKPTPGTMRQYRWRHNKKSGRPYWFWPSYMARRGRNRHRKHLLWNTLPFYEEGERVVSDAFATGAVARSF